jgi:DNA polymerase III delta prime subunit
VDDIRELRENVALAPMQGGKRVYILDEAHMLTTAAWNAFLKTLEEPPQHVVFVLATTEAHKVPATIIDRCHRFDFHRPLARADRRRDQAGGWRGGNRDPGPGRGHARPRGHRLVP